MENIYDDFAILSCDKVEKMAREYALSRAPMKILRERNGNTENEEKDRHFTASDVELKNECAVILREIENIFYIIKNQKLPLRLLKEIESIYKFYQVSTEILFSKIDLKIVASLSLKAKHAAFCGNIRELIIQFSLLAKSILNLLNHPADDSGYYKNLLENIFELIQKIVMLFGECRYRIF